MHDIISDTVTAIYASGKTIQTILLLLLLPVPVPTYDFKHELLKILVASDENVKKKTCCINSYKNASNATCSNANAVHWIYTRTKQKLDLYHHVNKRLDIIIVSRTQSNLGQAESKNPPWKRIPQWTVGLRYTHRNELLQKLQKEQTPVCDVIKQHFLEQPH